MFGWAGKILIIDLSQNSFESWPTKPYTSKFIGGRGIGAKLLYDLQRRKIDAFDPNNLIVLSTGPLTGTSFPGSGRVDITTKSPQTHYRLVTNIGGYFGPELKFAGYDHIIIRGKSVSPTLIYITNGEARLIDANDIWGKSTYESISLIRDLVDEPEAKIISIGKAGENMVRFASAISEMGFAAGRGGLGAVMGSKNLKAIAVRGTNGVNISKPNEFLDFTVEYQRNLIKKMEMQNVSGYYADTLDPRIKDHLVFGNYEEGDWDTEARMNHESYMKRVQIKKVGCFSCPVRCMHLVNLRGMGLSVSTCEPFWNFTGLIWNNDLDFTWQCIDLVNRYGLDSIETGGIIAYLIELFEKGLIDVNFTGGIALEKGNKEAVIQTIHNIANCEGFGERLKDGLDKIANEIGGEAIEMKVTSHNMFPHGYYFQAHKGAALLQAVGHSKGDCFPTYGTSIEMGIGMNVNLKKSASKIANEKYQDDRVFDGSENIEAIVKMVIDTEHQIRIPDLMGICLFVGNIYSDFEYYKKLSKAFYFATGVEINQEELMLAGERLRNLERIIDTGEGLSSEDDNLPKKFFKVPIRSGKHKDKILSEDEFEKTKKLYYRMRGWDVTTGYPLKEKLESLEL